MQPTHHGRRRGDLLRTADAVTACSAHTLAEAEAWAPIDLGPRGSVVYNNTRYLTQAEARANGLLPNYGQSFFVSTARVPLANFDGQDVINGFVMRVVARTTVVLGAVPEIDPATGGSTLSLVAGVLALLDHRRRRVLGACSGVQKEKSA